MLERYPRTTSQRQLTLARLEPATRARIEQAALALFSGREFHRVKLIDIARHARISLQTLYKYYGSKETVLFVSLDTWLGELASRMIDHLQASRTSRIGCARCSGYCWITSTAIPRWPRLSQLSISQYLAAGRYVPPARTDVGFPRCHQ